MDKQRKVYIAGHRGLVGSALLRRLQSQSFCHLITRTHSELNLCDQQAVEQFFQQEKPEFVFLAAAKVGGIYANDTYPAEFIKNNLLIQTNVIDAAYHSGVKKLLFLGSSCIYPKLAPQPILESCLLTGALEPTNEWYAIAKIAGIRMCQAYRKQYNFNAITVMPTNLYGPGDSFHLENGHVLSSMIRRFHEAKVHKQPSVTLWGTGTAYREFLHVTDLADACIFLMENYDEAEIINVGTGKDIIIKDLAMLVREIIAYPGDVLFDTTKPDGTPRKLLDISKMTARGWQAKISLREGIINTYQWFLQNQNNL